jgi:hypothetical protein
MRIINNSSSRRSQKTTMPRLIYECLSEKLLLALGDSESLSANGCITNEQPFELWPSMSCALQMPHQNLLKLASHCNSKLTSSIGVVGAYFWTAATRKIATNKVLPTKDRKAMMFSGVLLLWIATSLKYPPANTLCVYNRDGPHFGPVRSF